ncbi:MAG: MarR family transcriptional regulator [Clostridia bacterium]|nr:MarR family transcriptional regulator [Clostridia bacterium]MBR4577735.1 MarR family transcriptional regulator [Clostridia bacterium]
MNHPENDVILASLKLFRAMRRCPPPPMDPPPAEPFGRPERPCAPAVGRLLACIDESPNVSSRDLCELLDLRPSSLSEILNRAESEGWILRSVDEEDRRIQRVELSPKGKAFVDEMEAARRQDLDRKSACFTEQEKAQFCALCDKLRVHLESLASDLPPRPVRRPRPPFPPEGRIRC